MKINYCQLTIIILLIFTYLHINAQQASLTGKVTDLNSGLPLSGANVVIVGTKLGAVCDYDGKFLIRKIPEGQQILRVSFIGYEPIEKQVKLNASSLLNVDFSLKSQPFLADQAVITGNRVMVSRNVLPYSVTVVDAEKIAQSGESNVLPVISEQVPGVFVTERGITGFGVAEGSAGSISIRGVGSSPNTDVLVLIDGQPQFMGLFGHPLPDSYIASDVERAEVIRGPASLLYGTNAMGGVINIITHKEKNDGLVVNAKAEYGTYNTQKYTASAGFKKKRFGIFASYDHDQTDGHRDNSGFRLDNGFIKAGYECSPNWKIMADASVVQFESTDPGPANTTDTTYFTNPNWQDIVRGTGSITVQDNYSKSEGAAKFYLNFGDQKVYDGFHSIDYSTGMLIYQAIKMLPGNTITVGLDYNLYGGMAENIKPTPPIQFVDTTIFEQGTYVTVQQSLVRKLDITAGLRFHIHQVYGTEWVPQFGASFQAAPNISIKANISKGFRSPTIRELFMFAPANPNLLPERMWNYEIGWLQNFLQKRLSLELTCFYERGDNLILTEGQYPNMKYSNSGNFENYGVEFLGKFIVIKGLEFDANYSYLHTSKPILAAPRHQVFAEGTYQWKKFYFNLTLRYINHLYTQTEIPDIQNYAIVNARVMYTFNKYFSIYVSGQNLLDQEYTVNYDYPMPGITIMAGINFKLEITPK